MGFWYVVEEVDLDLCTIRSDGKGLIPLHDQFGPNVYCVPKWDMFGLGAVYYAILLLPLVLALIWTMRIFFFLWVRSFR